ncbi:DUF6894 family protein [Bosea rubneri]|jgi:CobQ-like glutamine amidotransferase family enzyme|uniref:DUF6894 domain-containing protein n=1 Tax=Bosea rubneri TaxID=3075434 RepID=A0ABU3SB27_9HYPH|nr:hypothetical protein [Bosea sp. ZW T0_25]MDU0341993.1 hypothetical protein [Bosea sp. ZW T0_25]
MPTYRFAVSDGERLDLTGGIELLDDATAVKEAHRALGELVRDLPRSAAVDFRVAVENEAGTVLYQASLTFRGETAADMTNKRANGEPKP